MSDVPKADFERFVHADGPYLFGYVVKLGLRFQEAQDVVSETHCRQWQKWPTVATPKAWCRTTASHLAVDMYRADARLVLCWEVPEYSSVSLGPGADDLVMLKEEQQAVVAWVRALPWKQREQFALHLDGFGNEEIAELLDANVATVASNVRHARRSLMKTLERDGYFNTNTLRGGEPGGRDGS